jgi:hypothetical protein
MRDQVEGKGHGRRREGYRSINVHTLQIYTHVLATTPQTDITIIPILSRGKQTQRS